MPTARVVLRGTRHYDAPRAAARGDLNVGTRLALIAEEGNRYDADAVEVRLAKTGDKLGYLSRNIAARYRHRIKAGMIGDVKIANVEMGQDREGQPQLRVEILIQYQAVDSDAADANPTSPRLRADDLPSGPGVYAVINDVTQRSYIGSSQNVKARCAQHFRDLASGSHANVLLQKDYTAQLSRGFTAMVVQRLQHPEQCDAAERQAIILALRQNQKLYNMTDDGQGSSSARLGNPVPGDAAEAISERTVSVRPRSRIRSDPQKGEVTSPRSFNIPTPDSSSSVWWLWIICPAAVVLWLLLR